MNHGGVQQRRCIIIITDKIYMYSLGNILWIILTAHSSWKMVPELQDKVQSKVLNGGFTNLPDNFNQTKLTTDPVLMAIHTAMIKCLRYNPHDRPTADEIAAELVEAYDNLPEGFGDKKKWMELIDEREVMNT